jgi:prepilin-type N-terminal cleavage/methylation domain-containing protein
VKRSGFSLVELVFAIIIIAISLMSVPMLIGETSKSNQYSFIQESVMAARTKLGNILTFPWDQNSTLKNSKGVITAILVVQTHGDSNLSKITGSFYRRGHIKDPKRRHYDTNHTVFAQAIAQDSNITDIGDFDNSSTTLTLTGGSGTEGDFDYLDKNDLNITTRVYFVNDKLSASQSYKDSQILNFVFNPTTKRQDAPSSSNIKMVELSVESAYSDTPFILRAFSSNIGGIAAYYSKVK